MRRSASEIIRNLESRIARLEKQSVRKTYLQSPDEKPVVQVLKRKLRKVGVENIYHLLLVALHEANFHREARAISDALGVQGDGRDEPILFDAGRVIAAKCGWDASYIARVFAEANKKDNNLIMKLTMHDLL